MMTSPKEKAPTLGDKLQATVKALEDARIKGLDEQSRADVARVKRERARREKFVDKIRKTVIAQIEAGRVPAVKVTVHADCEWIRDAEKGKAPYQDFWSTLIQDFGQEKLRLHVVEGHDGMGMESWVTVTAQPSPSKIVYRGDGTREISAAEREMDPRPVIDPRIRSTTREIRDGLDIS
jgi:hypothetical protein